MKKHEVFIILGSVLLDVLVVALLFSLIAGTLYGFIFVNNLAAVTEYSLNAILILSFAAGVVSLLIFDGESLGVFLVWQAGMAIASVALSGLLIYGFDIWHLFFLVIGLFGPVVYVEIPKFGEPPRKLKQIDWPGIFLPVLATSLAAVLNWLVIKFVLIGSIDWLVG